MAMELHRGVFVTLITLFFFVQFGFSSTTTTATETERQALVQLRKSLGISRLAPKTAEPCRNWTGVKCRNGRVVALNITVGTGLSLSYEPHFLTFVQCFRFRAQMFHSRRLTKLQVLDLRFCSLTGSIPSSLGGLTELTFLSLSGNELTGRLPSELGRLSGLTVLDLSDNSLTGTVPNTVSSLRYLTRIDLSRNFLSGLNLSDNAFTGSLLLHLGSLSSLVTLDLSKNSLSGSLPSVLFSILFKLEVLILNENAFDGTIPATLWSGINLQFLDLSGYKITGPLPKLATSNNVNYSGATFNVSNNLLYGSLNNILLSKFKVIDLSNNYFQGEVQIGGFNNDVTALARNCLRMIPNQRNFGVCYFQGEVQIGGFNNDVTALARNCLRMIPNQRNFGACRVFYVQRRLAFSPGSAQGPAQSPLQNSKSRNNKEVIFILVGIFVGLGFIMILIPVLVVLLKRGENHGSIITIQRQRGTTNVGTDPEVENPTAPPKDHEFKASLGESFSYEQMLHFTYNFAEANLIKHVRFHMQDWCRLGCRPWDTAWRTSMRNSVYKYMPNGDLATSLHSITCSDDKFQSLDWITRLKFGFHQGNDTNMTFNLYSLRLLINAINAKKFLVFGSSFATCSQDVYCFGKVLLELITGNIGFSNSDDAATKEWLEHTLSDISIYDKDQVSKIVDPNLIVDDDLLEEVWAVAIVAKSCLSPKPSKRPPMRYVLKALENPVNVVREESYSSRLRTSSSRSWSFAILGSWRLSSSEISTATGTGHTNREGTNCFKHSGRVGSQGSGGMDLSSIHKRSSNGIFPEPLATQGIERQDEH
ncbi:hypothetical protein Ahy_A07g034462 [Arachis hypogaea]|uniref:Leucine-rich repeat-containing N-terminal plant-type domain-containing protein n=1 Tax=Arachis hypogaea TaxID=3818 RepID=A0A445CBW8_ARAHY|nr:hypothetical protein Ahy_A07g034462 [Arachis hypogaea]